MLIIGPIVHLLAAAAFTPAEGSAAQPACSREAGCVVDEAAAQKFALAERLAAAGDLAQAQRVLGDLTRHPTLELTCLSGGRDGTSRASQLLERVVTAIKLPSVARILRDGNVAGESKTVAG